MKSLFRSLHLYLSLAAGSVIMAVCFSGAVLVFEKEIQMACYPERYKVVPGVKKLPLDFLIKQLKLNIPDAQIVGVKVFKDPARTVEIQFKESDPVKEKTSNIAPSGQRNGKERDNINLAFINPYTGVITSYYNHRKSFFYTMIALHRWLLAEDVGKMIVGISTSFFLFILMTGIILWWPKKRKILQQRLTLKWNSGWKRINHDLHIVVGFYTAIFLFASAFTGLAWSFKWFNEGIFWITRSENKPPKPPVPIYQSNTALVSASSVYHLATQQFPQAEFYGINFPKDSSDVFTINIMPSDAIHERATHQLYVDQYKGNMAGKLLFRERNLGQRVRATFYPIHVGSIGGLPGRVVALTACLAGVTFPLTGLVLWINRLRKKKQKTNKGKVNRPLIHMEY